MSAPTARKRTPAKKAAAKKAAPKPERTEAERTEANIAQFEEYRERARKLKLSPKNVELDPYFVSAATLDDGIDEDVILKFPATFRQKAQMQQAVAMGNWLGFVELLGGPVAVNRLLFGFERYATENDDDDELLFVGFCYTVLNYFRGQGAADVPGGTPAS